MNIIDFNRSHMERAVEIAKANYEEERLTVPVLPEMDTIPELGHFADNGLGVAAMEGDMMLGFLCAYYPREDAFGCTKVRGTFTPIHAHGVIANADIARITGNEKLNRDRIYSLLYQEAAKKWVKAGIRSHAVALYTHDKEAETSFYYNGFGLRCIDAIRSLENSLDLPAAAAATANHFDYCELPREDWRLLLNEHNGLISHLGDSPAFMKYNLIDEAELYRRTSEDVRYFGAKQEGCYIAYIKLSNNGENFVTEHKGMVNICGAFCQLEYRGTGVYKNLLNYLISTLKNEGYQLLGVDCESFNPTARGFWLKYFTEYTHSVVRRIDEGAFSET